MKRPRSPSSDMDDDEEIEGSAIDRSRAWDDPAVLEEMGLGLLSDAASSQDNQSEEEPFALSTSDDDFTENKKSDDATTLKQQKKKRKLTEHHREPLKQQQVIVNDEPTHENMSNKDYKSDASMKTKCDNVKQDVPSKDIVCTNDFMTTRKPPPLYSGPDNFASLPDEIILAIFRMLDRKSLVQCCTVSKQFSRVASDEALWCRIDLGGRSLPPGGVSYLLRRDPFIVRLASACIPDPVIMPNILNDNFVSKLTYLDLSMAVISAKGLANMLRYCKRLKKLSLEKCTVSNEVAKAIACNESLEILNLTMCTRINPSSLHKILSHCTRLQSLNLGWTLLSPKSIEILAFYIPSCVERLNISGCRENLSDEMVLQILKKCDNLLELDLSDCINLTEKVIDHIVRYASGLEYLAMSRCYAIPLTCLHSLKKVKTLTYVDLFGLCSEAELKLLRRSLEGKTLNQFMFSSVARPTVGVRRTSIWGLRVRD